jgi:hypothetical protein
MKYKSLFHSAIFFTLLCCFALQGCTKYEKGFLSPYMQYAVSEFTIIRGRVAKSYSLVTDGSSIPMKVRWTHIYDSTGKIVDEMFSTKYEIPVWTAAYDALLDKTYEAISAKRGYEKMTPLVINESNGTIEANEATRFIPLGKYVMDLEVSNEAGTQELKKIMTITIKDGEDVEIAPTTGSFSNSLLVAGTAGGAGSAGGVNGGVFFNGANNPYAEYTLTRIADTPNVFIMKITDRNGVVFNPQKGEVAKRPNSGTNPNPPFLQNLEDYAPDTFTPTDTAMVLKYPLVPFPIASLGNGFNMYYRIPSKFVSIDSTKAWTTNTAGSFYQGKTDSHYLGEYTGGRFDYSIRIPMRIQVPGSYILTIKILNTTHK